MDFLSAIFGTAPTTREGLIGSELMGSYQRHRALEEVADYLYDDEDELLHRENARLDLAMKRRMLGLPMDSDDLDAANNSDTPFITQMTTLAGARALQAIPSPNLLQGAGSVASHVRLPWEGSNMARSAIGALSAIGGKYVSPIGRFFR